MFPELRALLLASEPVTDITTGIYPDVVPEGKALPAISAFMISERVTDPIDAGDAAVMQQNWQINCIATTRKTAAGLSDAVRAALHRRAGSGIHYALVSDRNYDLPDTGSDIRRVIMDVTLTQ